MLFLSWSVGGGDGDGDGEETNRSLSLWRTLTSSEEEEVSGGSSGGGWKRRRSLGRVRNMRRVLRRRRWITGLVVGLRVGLPAMAHCVAKSLNLWRLGIVRAFRERKKWKERENEYKYVNFCFICEEKVRSEKDGMVLELESRMRMIG